MTIGELEEWVPQWVQTFSKRQLILLSGDLGAGKTALTRVVFNALGCNEVNSPTYGLIHEYEVPERENCYHVDLYRLQEGNDLESSGFWEIFSNAEGLVFVEWANTISLDQYPLQWEKWTVEIEKTEDDSVRTYKIKKI